LRPYGALSSSEVDQISVEGFEMPTHGLLVEELSRIISQATAPAFLLGATAAFISVLIGRLNRVVDGYVALQVNEAGDPSIGRLRVSMSSLTRRVKLLNRALEYAVIAAIFIVFLVIAAFASVAVGINQVYGAALLFVVALGFFAASLICFWLEVRIARGSIEQIHQVPLSDGKGTLASPPWPP
jgi:hypothetical protein